MELCNGVAQTVIEIVNHPEFANYGTHVRVYICLYDACPISSDVSCNSPSRPES